MPGAIADSPVESGGGGFVKLPPRGGDPISDPSRWESLPEIVVLAQLANKVDATFHVPGSLAMEVITAYDRFPTSDGSLFDFVPPLSDVDVRVASWEHRARLLGLLQENLPTSRFFHWDVRTDVEAERYEGTAFLYVEHEPALVFLPAKGGHSGPKHPAVSGIRFRHDGSALHVEGIGQFETATGVLRPEPVVMPRRTVRHATLDDAAAMLLDVVYVARRFPSQTGNSPLQQLTHALQKYPARAIAKWFSRHPRERHRLVRLALKLSYSLRTRSASVEQWIGNLLDEVANASSGLLRSALQAVTHPRTDAILVTTVRPKLRKGSWHPRVVDVREIAPHAATAQETEKGIIGPSVPVMVEDPSPAGCCHYRDFSRGIAEVAWSSSSDETSPRHAHFVGVHLGDETASLEEPPLAQAWVSAHGRHASLRVDYGFLCTLAGRRGTVNVQGRINRE